MDERDRKRQRVEGWGGSGAGAIVPQVEQKILLRCEQHPGSILQGLGELFEQGQLCDVTIRVGGVDFEAHRVVLAASSEFLRVLLVGGWRESEERVVELGGVDVHSFRTIINFIYSGKIVVSDVMELLNLLVASEHLQVHAVRDLCVQRLQQRLDLLHALQMRIYAREVGCIELEEAASEVVWGQFSQVVAAGDHFMKLEESQLSEVLESDKLAVDSEEEVFSALMKWIKHDKDREEALPRLLKHVRLPMLSPLELERVETDPMVKNVFKAHDDNRRLLQEAKLYHRMPSPDQSMLVSTPATRRRPQRVGKALFALGGRPAWRRVEKFEPKTNDWTEMSPMGQQRMRHGSATVGGLIYVVGGKDEKGRALSSVERYNPHLDTWEKCPSLQVARTGVGVCTLAGMLYAVGGRHDSGYRLKTVECFNVQTQVWEPCVPMSIARGALRVAALDGFLYVVGGRSEQGTAISSVERYSPMDEKWSPVAPMATARVGAGLEVLDGFLYAIGGKDEKGSKLRTVERYDPKRDQWSPVASMGTKRWGAGVAVMECRLWVIGGMNGAERGALPTVEVYDARTDTWSELNPGPKLARGSCTFAAA